MSITANTLGVSRLAFRNLIGLAQATPESNIFLIDLFEQANMTTRCRFATGVLVALSVFFDVRWNSETVYNDRYYRAYGNAATLAWVDVDNDMNVMSPMWYFEM